MPAEGVSLEYENAAVLSALQAGLRLIGPEMVAFSVEVTTDWVRLHFWLRSRSPEIDEDIEDIFADFDSFFVECSSPGSVELHVGTLPDPQHIVGRMVYWAKY